MKKINWWAIVAVVALIFSIFSWAGGNAIKAQPPVVSIPNLTKGEHYEVTLNNVRNPVELEIYMGLARGDIAEMRQEGSATIIVFASDYKINGIDVDNMQTAFGKPVRAISVK